MVCELPLRGAGGEPVSFSRTVHSHGCARLPPAAVDERPLVYRRRLQLGARVVEIAMREQKNKLVAESDAAIGPRDAEKVESTIVRMFRLNDDLSDFYAQIAHDDSLAWATKGAGRILASPSVFEDVVKTICTTNCTWSATVRMTTALVALGKGAFPGAQSLAGAPEGWYRDVARMGYRGPYIRAIAAAVSAGELDLESLRPGRYDDEEVEERLLALPGVGPYAAAHVMLMLGRHRHLVLDSWTRPKFRRLAGKKRAADSTIRRAFARYGAFAGLAFWLYLTRDWLDE
jgi:3-methyladenine DNA glycosylase/8-oxoguanine DNA glycosylase